jgi:ABC-type Fe3+-hydroxamate transport system substrate-binding protein
MSLVRILDDRERELVFSQPPQRIVSLVPSDTLTLFDLGAGSRVVGRTRYCVAPEGQVEAIPVVGGTKDVDADAVAALQPDLVLVNQEENTPHIVKALAERRLAMFVSFPRTVMAGLSHASRLALILGLVKDERAKATIARGYAALRAAEDRLAADAAAGREPLPVFVPIWLEPLMTVSGETYVSDILCLAGARNVFAGRQRRYPLAADQGRAEAVPDAELKGRDTRYPRITLAEVEAAAPEAVLLPDEPHLFTEADALLFRGQRTPAAVSGRVRLCGGRDLTWHGTHSIEALGRVRALVESLREKAGANYV